jgi:hypothetical protein
MTQRVLGPTGSRSRATRSSLLLMALVGLIFGVLIGGGGFASAAKPGPAVVDYSQCADGTAVPEVLDCPKGWINGILNTNNSTYHENQVTPQRLIVDFPSGADHTIDLSWLVRKGDAHAYDSLATWNFTQTAADPCQDLSGPTGDACETATGGDEFPLAIPDDDLEVDSACTTGSTTTSDHQLPGQELLMYGLGTGGGVDSMVYNGTTSDSEGLFQSATISFHFGSNAGGRAYLYFGGHLARGPNSWGDDCGAGSINGGPYHIKVDAIDDASAGSRDNQIMSGAVLPLVTPTLATTPTATPTTSVNLSDQMNVGDTTAQGTADFYLYSDATCTTLVDSDLNVAVTNGVATSKTITVTPTADATYYWLVHYDGDALNNFAPADTLCGDETASVVVATTSVKTLP